MDISSYTFLPYSDRPWLFYWVVFLLLVMVFLACLAIIGVSILSMVLMKEKPSKETFQQVGATLFLFIFLHLGLDWIASEQSKEYVFNEDQLMLFDLSESDEYTDATLVDTANFSDLSPYFKFERGRKRRNYSYSIYFKYDDGTTFDVLRCYSLRSLAEKYFLIHQKHPTLSERFTWSDYSTFEDFIQKVNELNQVSSLYVH